MSQLHVWLARNLTEAEAVKKTREIHLTVEAEYGANVVEGTVFTAAHHQRTGKFSPECSPAPCNHPGISQAVAHLDEISILVSHIDLDTIGGCLRAHPVYKHALFRPEHQAFWALAEFLDLNGYHKIAASGSLEDEAYRIDAWRAWAAAHPLAPPPHGVNLLDVSAYVETAGDALLRILRNDDLLISAGFEFWQSEEDLNETSWRQTFVVYGEPLVVVREAKPGQFVGHLYRLPTNQVTLGSGVASVSVVYHTETGAITIATAETLFWLNCREYVQERWGPEAGGRHQVAGSPRGERLTYETAIEVAKDIVARLQETVQ